MKPVGLSLKRIRERHNLSKRKLAMKSGVERTYITRWESGNVDDIKFKTAAFTLSKGFGLTPKEFACMLIDEILLDECGSISDICHPSNHQILPHIDNSLVD